MEKMLLSPAKIWGVLLLVIILFTSLVPGFAADTTDQEQQLEQVQQQMQEQQGKVSEAQQGRQLIR